MRLAALVVLLWMAISIEIARGVPPQVLPGTEPLKLDGDIASRLVDGVDKFLLRKLDQSVAQREKHWKRDFSSAAAFDKSIEPNRRRLAEMLGAVDPRVAFDAPQLVGTMERPALVGRGKRYDIFAVRWPVLEDPSPLRTDTTVYGEGLLLVPSGGKAPLADVVAIPDADQTPEQIVGLAEGAAAQSQFARRLAEGGCRVLVPVLIDRQMRKRHCRANLTNREYLYRSGFELGRHLIGYEVQKVLAAVDWFEREARKDKGDKESDKRATDAPHKIGLVGVGEGGMLALYAAALDPRIDAACVAGYYDDRNAIWSQPIDRNVFGLLDEFGDAELASMVVSRILQIAPEPAPRAKLPGEGGAPARLSSPRRSREEFERFLELIHRSELSLGINHSQTFEGAFDEFFSQFTQSQLPDDSGTAPKPLHASNPAARQQRQIDQIDRHNQLLLVESPYVRAEFMKKLDFSSVEAYRKSAEEYRRYFYERVIGRFDDKLLPANPRTRLWKETDQWTAYEVVLDVWPDVIAYGILVVPKGIKEGERRPVVVCQHGLEGRPEHVIVGDHGAYHDFAAKLAERGFITFAPQNLYLFEDRFRTLQRKANPLGKTLFSIIVPQHQQITDWLKTLPFVDGQRIGFYGLSYGGKTAMRVPPLLDNYCLSICSADFNDWVWKNASTRSPYSYVWTSEHEIFEWNLGQTFNYAEMAALVAPRPFMVERGHFDGVAPDERVAAEFAKVRHLYQAKLKLPEDHCQIEFFVGPHTINGKGTFEFLHKHLKWGN